MADQGSSSEGTLLQLLESLDKKSQSSSNNIQTLADYGCKWVPLVHRIPDEIRKLNEGAYTPTVVSIGPLRRDEEHLQPMEKEKFCYMQCLFKRFENEGLEQPYMQVLVEHCARAMLEIEPSAHYWYSDSKIRPDNEVKAEVKFAEMMLIDGCFIIELLYRNRISTSMYSITDPILDNYFMRFAVQNDLIRLENQIPFEVLENLFSLTLATLPHNDQQFSLKECIFIFFKHMMGLEITPDLDTATKPFHILDLLHSWYRPELPLPLIRKHHPLLNKCTLNSAIQLDLAGVKFKPASGSNLFDVQFYSYHHSWFRGFRSGCFEIPKFCVTFSTETLLRNFIAMEQFFPYYHPYFTSHAFLMDKLINTAKDVDLLVEAGVIHNYLGSSESVADLYNNICKNVYLEDFYFTEQCKQVTDYCNLFWPRFIVKLKRDYFGNPWSGISVFAAILLFVLTSLQAIYTMLSYYDKK